MGSKPSEDLGIDGEDNIEVHLKEVGYKGLK
jgi:hypothetical protein